MNTHELVLFIGKDETFQCHSTLLRFDPFDWMSYKAIRALCELRAFGNVSKEALVLVPAHEITMKGDGQLLLDGESVCLSVFVRDSSRGTGWQPNRCFLGNG